MIELALSSLIATTPPVYEERLDVLCSYIVGIPYASDNFTDEEWERFKLCKKLIRQ